MIHKQNDPSLNAREDSWSFKKSFYEEKEVDPNLGNAESRIQIRIYRMFAREMGSS